MSMTAVNGDYAPVPYPQQTVPNAAIQADETQDVSIYTQEEEANKPVDVDSVSTDGKDDGKLEDGVFGLFVKKTCEGLLKKIATPVTEALKGNFVPALVTAAGIALACNPVTGPFVIAIGTGAAALGTISSGVAVASDIKALNECAATPGTTDADAKAIVSQMGDHAANGILSLTALVGGAKSMRNRAGTKMNDLKLKAANGEKVTIRQQIGAYGKDTLDAGVDVAKAGFGKLTAPIKYRAEVIKDSRAHKQYAKDNNLGESLSQDEIDSLIKQVNDDTAAQQQVLQKTGEKVMSQSDIDELVKTYSTEGKMSQSDIDELVQTYSTEGKMSQADIDEMARTYSTEGKMSQSDIDELVQTYSTEGKMSQTDIDEMVRTYSTDGKMSQADIDALVNKTTTLKNNTATSKQNKLELQDELKALKDAEPKSIFGTHSTKWKNWNAQYQAKRSEWLTARQQYKQYRSQYAALGQA